MRIRLNTSFPAQRLVKKSTFLLLILLLALVLRIWNFPDRYQVLDTDELGYVAGGLLLWEGITPQSKFAPAGPLTWSIWSYSAIHSIKHFLLPGKEKSGTSWAIRPFFAVDRTLFDLYRDMSPLRQGIVVLNILISLLAIGAAFQMGTFRAGLPGGLLAGGLMAMVPQFIILTEMGKPYAMAWSFSIIAHYFAVTQTGRRRWMGSAVFMGLAISSRVEMTVFVLFTIWEFFYRKEEGTFKSQVSKFLGTTWLIAFLVAPWILTNLLGNLRMLLDYRFFGPPIKGMGYSILRDFLWKEGLFPTLFLLAVGLAIPSKENRRPIWLLAAMFGFLFLSLLKGTGYGLRHHGEVFIAVITQSPLALQYIRRRSPGWVLFLVAGALLLPPIQAISTFAAAKKKYCPDEATAWVKRHIPAGTTVYLKPTFHDPLPTPKAADALWSEVNGEEAWQKKFRRGLSRWHYTSASIPRALSEENLIQERGNRRRWFILGGQEGIPEPRYSIKIFSGGSAFDIPEHGVSEAYKKTGGVLIWRGFALKNMGKPTVSWTNSENQGTFVYCSFISHDSNHIQK